MSRLDSLSPKTVADIADELKSVDRAGLEAMKKALEADTRIGVTKAIAAAERRIDAQEQEERRLSGLYEYQRELARGGIALGLDEVGRGPIAGPLAVGAVVLPDEPRIQGINDSKQLTAEKRESLAAVIKDTALAWHIEYVEPGEIDAMGMSRALRKAFGAAIKAIESQGIIPDAILLDGNPLHLDQREVNIIKGDARCASISAASIIAKVDRDEMMRSYDLQYPGYDLASNKGYGSAEHIEAVKTLGLSPIHRASFCTSFLQETLF